VIVIARIVGHPKRAKLEAILVPPGMVFVAENHVNIIYPPRGAPLEPAFSILIPIINFMPGEALGHKLSLAR
jgi:hypothetical protein